MEDETILMSYVMSGLTPNRCYLVRLRVIGQRVNGQRVNGRRVNGRRNGIELLPDGE